MASPDAGITSVTPALAKCRNRPQDLTAARDIRMFAPAESRISRRPAPQRQSRRRWLELALDVRVSSFPLHAFLGNSSGTHACRSPVPSGDADNPAGGVPDDPGHPGGGGPPVVDDPGGICCDGPGGGGWV